MRSKIKIGFTLIGLVLFLAGVTSYMELTSLTSSVQSLIDNGAKSISLSKNVLDILQEQNSKVINIYGDKVVTINSVNSKELMLMDSLYSQAVLNYPRSEELDAMIDAKQEYISIFAEKIDSSSVHMSHWYLSKYNVAYNNFASAIKSFMLSSQKYVVDNTAKLKSSIYRTSMQSVVALSVSIVILFVFFLMIDVFYIKPVTSMTKALDRYLFKGVRFNVEISGKDEPSKLRELIIVMVQRLKDKL